MNYKNTLLSKMADNMIPEGYQAKVICWNDFNDLAHTTTYRVEVSRKLVSDDIKATPDEMFSGKLQKIIESKTVELINKLEGQK